VLTVPTGCRPDAHSRLDGILFSGLATDVAPWFYGREPLPGLGTWDTQRDEWEIESATVPGMPGSRCSHLQGLPAHECCARGDTH